MAVMQNNLIFGGVDSSDYGIYISGEGVFNAPSRDVEMIAIPGRNGSFALDKGRFENITVTYPAFNYEADMETFKQNLDAFRNAVCSKVGYQRLMDSFHPTEYRMATYISGLEITPVKYNTAAIFDIVFECKPQRWAMSGEEAIEVSDGDEILNPTLFEAKPMLEVKGYGDIDINGQTITIENKTLGTVIVSNGGQYPSVTLNKALYKTGDLIHGRKVGFLYRLATVKYAITPKTGYAVDKTEIASLIRGSFTAGTSSTSTTTSSMTGGNVWSVDAPDTQYSFGISASITVAYDGDNIISISITPSATGTGASYIDVSAVVIFDTIYVDSTVSALGDPLYIDLDIGEAYKEENGGIASVNDAVQLPAKLPILAPGANTITFDNTITELKVIPRWWKI